jgi:hypothetical protein
MVTNESQETLEQSGWEFQSEEIPNATAESDFIVNVLHDDFDDTLTLADVANVKDVLTTVQSVWHRSDKRLVRILCASAASNYKFELPIVQIKKVSGSVLEVRGAFPDISLDGGANAQDELFSHSPFGILIRATWRGAISVANCTIEQFPLYPVFG